MPSRCAPSLRPAAAALPAPCGRFGVEECLPGVEPATLKASSAAEDDLERAGEAEACGPPVMSFVLVRRMYQRTHRRLCLLMPRLALVDTATIKEEDDVSGGYENLHPVFAERLRRLNEACGTSILSGWRSSQRQQELYDGYMQGLPGYNPANQPGSSNHEACPWGEAMALAADLQGDLAQANARAGEFGLHFPIANVEPWHCQPVEVTYAYYGGFPAEWGGGLGRGVLKAGAQGQGVVECQQRLNAHGFACAVDGDFGPATEARVVEFQQAMGLDADGIVGAATWEALDVQPSDPQPAPIPAPTVTTGRRPAAELRLSSQGAALIAEFEGKSTVLYNDPAGHCTIGIGHLVHEGPTCGCEAEARFANGLSDEECYELFINEDVPRYEQPVRDLVSVPLKQSEFDALVSFTYNVGAGALEESTLRRLLNEGNYEGAANEFRKWCKAGGQVLEGLVRRRDREAAYFRSEWGDAAPPPPPPAEHPPWPGHLFQQGDSSHDIQVWQAQMKHRGWPIEPDGTFGPQTHAVVLQFQEEKGLAADGVIGQKTWEAAWTALVL